MAKNAGEDKWERALWNNDRALLQELLHQEAPTTSSFKLERHLRQLYMMSHLTPGRISQDYAVSMIIQIADMLPELRREIGGWVEQRVYDLSVLQWIRRNSALSVVLGAGATIAAQGPSWPELVKRLLTIAIERGNEILVYEKTELGAKARVDRVERLGPSEENEARRILAQIQNARSVDTELLMRGAQICADLFQESLFQKVTMILYPAGKRKPSLIHTAIASLAHWQNVAGLGTASGWRSIISYNFDSLMNDALESERIPYTLSLMRNRQIFRRELEGDPNPDRSLPVIHLHGFTPRQPFFDLRGVDFVFSTRQFSELYEKPDETIIGYAMNHYISHPAYVGLYVGCSFTDEAMNSALRNALKRFPGRFHYALVQLPEEFQKCEDIQVLDRETERYTTMGVRPVWFTDFDEIPGLIQRLA